MNKETDLHKEVQVVTNHWNDSNTETFVGKTGHIRNVEDGFVDVLIERKVITFHSLELQLL